MGAEIDAEAKIQETPNLEGRVTTGRNSQVSQVPSLWLLNRSGTIPFSHISLASLIGESARRLAWAVPAFGHVLLRICSVKASGLIYSPPFPTACSRPVCKHPQKVLSIQYPGTRVTLDHRLQHTCRSRLSDRNAPYKSSLPTTLPIERTREERNVVSY